MNLAQRIELWPVDRLTPYERNARTHSPEQVAKIAASIVEFGFNNPILVDSGQGIIAGHGRMAAARRLNLPEVPVIVLDHLSESQRRAYVLADNRLAELAGWDMQLLADELRDLNDDGFDLEAAGFDDDTLAALLDDGILPAVASSQERQEREEPTEPEADDDAPEVQALVVSQSGDVWVLGEHRVMCGSSTDVRDVARLMNGRRAQLLHADPPYGMGKEADGVANDNLRGRALDGFQLDWWGAFRPHLESNASAYIWGNAPDLWRLWYVAGLGETEKLELRNEIVWDKVNIPGMASPDLTQYPEASERCLFFQFGDQFLGNVNSADFPETWEPLRAYLEGEAEAAGMTAGDVKRVCGVGMYGHWFTRSQFTLIPEGRYQALRSAYPGHFLREWSSLKAEWDRVKGGPTSDIQGARSYFDNGHEPMTDVWRFPRVVGDDRHGHATPKPVAMMVRAIKSSCPRGGLVAEPFGGSGSTLMGAEVSGRACYVMEMQAHYVDVIVRRWQQHTGKDAALESTGKTFADVAASRAPANDNAEPAHAVA